MNKNKLTLRMLKNTDFEIAYRDFLFSDTLSRKKYVKILSLATLFLNSSDKNVNRLGYRIIVIYCNKTGDYKPLYDIAINSGITPVAQYIDDKIMSNDKRNFFTEFNAAYNSSFFINNVYCSLQQKELIEFYDDNNNESLSIVAPTSYGKTDLILNTVQNCDNKNVCIITPTKSLLAQTKLRIIKDNSNHGIKVIIHPEMYNGQEERILAVMTQERVLRLLKKEPDLIFDYVIIDEAHGLLRDDSRNKLLASVILILEKRNPDIVFKFLTPFLCDAGNIKVRFTDYSLKTFMVDEYIKTERFYLVEMRDGRKKCVKFYDQFLNQFYKVDYNLRNINEWKYIRDNAGFKNIIYFNKPKDIENFVAQVNKNYAIIQSELIEEACKNISEYVHPKYRLIESLKRGVIYHHGAVPDPVRMYIEKIYTDLDEIKFVVTSSTLLEGVNIPADRIFLLDNKKGNGNLNPSDFKNLIGRVCRFSQIFNKDHGDLKRLEPQVHLVIGKYYSQNANPETFISKSMYVEKMQTDDMKNVMLNNTIITEEKKPEFDKAQEFVENYENGIIPEYKLRKVTTEIGKSCFLNNITEFDVFDNENEMSNLVSYIKNSRKLIDSTAELFVVLNTMFFSRIDDDNISRFQYQETQNFYKMFLDWRITNTSLNQMISSFIRYWKGILNNKNGETVIYVGHWGDITREGHRPMWTDISNKTESELINLAIVRIKEEQDFLDNVIIKYIEVLNDMELVDEDLYLCIKYATNDRKIITCIKNGISISLAKILVDEYLEYVVIDTQEETLVFKEGLLDAMKEDKINEVLICEMQFYL